MRRWLEAPEQVPGSMAASVAEIMDAEEALAKETGDGQVKWRSASDRQKVRDDCTECVTILEPILFQHVVPHSYQVAVRFEAPATLPHPDGSQRQVLLIGEMDLLTHPADGYRVLDLKMTRDTGYWRKTFPQLIFYELAVFLLKGEWPLRSALIQPMCPDPLLPFTFSDEHRQELLVKVCNYAESVWRDQHSPKASAAGCDRCYVKHACPRFAPVGKRVPLRSL